MKSDAQIKQDILDELVFQPNIDETEIGVIVKDGVVTLTGFVDAFSKKVAAEKAAKSVAGVKAVAEDIQIKYGDDYRKTDQEIAKAAVNALEWNASVPNNKILVKVDDGYIVLTGDVTWKYQKNAAKRTIENLLGVKGVVNNIEIIQKVEPKEVKEQIEKAFERSADIDAQHVLVKIEGSVVTLTGTVSSIKEKDDATKAAFHAPGVTEVKNEIKVQFYPAYA
ncbi:BON domain-containing protein [Maribacter sp. ACAM166]|uniref:BON domain-containing protein n=1 Tax=Maribacter sp. ACAM166 TaxID=2508996 RepID=UPI0010FDB820|nr:BON domain-containing protein [Maribacter sp. ACAM166]TLP81734.1 BON domain-containing protein [Maribacter sp. ACAM166]